jgi:(heptosyl)LPS beta-1,4-glucosyltransferase
MAISVVINTYNEADKLKDCLASVKNWVDEIVVVDMGSTDGTRKVAEKFGAKIYKEKLVQYVELIRNSSVKKATSGWILVLDPDERAPLGLAKKLKKIAKEDKFDAVNIPRKNIIFGKWIRHTNWWPDRHVRFFKKGKVIWAKKIHLYPEVNGEVINLPAKEELAIEHLNYEAVSQFLSRQNRYSEILAQNYFDEGEQFSWFLFFWRPTRIFLQRYLRHAGILDGFYGLAITFLAVLSQIATEVKLWEKTACPPLAEKSP